MPLTFRRCDRSTFNPHPVLPVIPASARGTPFPRAEFSVSFSDLRRPLNTPFLGIKQNLLLHWGPTTGSPRVYRPFRRHYTPRTDVSTPSRDSRIPGPILFHLSRHSLLPVSPIIGSNRGSFQHPEGSGAGLRRGVCFTVRRESVGERITRERQTPTPQDASAQRLSQRE